MKNIHKKATFSWRDCLTTVLTLTIVTCVSFLLRMVDKSDTYVPMLFVTAVFIISRYTSGYFLGIISSFIGVILVNYIFTYPYFQFNFTISGYPITFISMLATSVMTSAMTTQIKVQESYRVEAEKEKMRGNLLRCISHDLRTPLTSILGTTSALLDNGDKIPIEKQRELLKESHDDAEWLIRMVENLLSVTKMNTRETKIKKSLEAVEEVIGEAVSKFNKRFTDADVSVSVPDKLLIIPMDAILIEQVLINLLENAVIHGEVLSGIHVTVTKHEDYALFEVHDNGIGIQESMLEHIFDGYFSTVNNSQTEDKRNMGIGLSVCMSIVKAHGGEMSAENKSEGGAVFRFSIPLKEDEICR